MPKHTLVSEAFASGADIGPVVAKLEEVLKDVPRTHALIALTSIILLLQYPNITTDQLYEGVKEVSRFVCMWLADTDVGASDEPVDKMRMN